MTYVSLYRKYRSKTFDDLVGQDHITTTLKNAIEKNRIGHAYLFSGPRGTGKTSTARIFAKMLNCAEGPAATPCNVCDICNAITSDSLFDVIEIDAASNRGIDDIRDLREKVRVPPTQARYKVYIIDEVHMLTKEAFNALLKTLEEPPSYVIFLMATTEPQKLLSTILSRCQRFDFRRLTDEEIGTHIRNIAAMENFTIDDEALATVVKTADGSMRDSISILDQLVSFSAGVVSSDDVNSVFGLVERREISRFMNALFSGDVSATFDIFNSFFQAGKSFSLFLRYLMEYVRDLYLIKQKVRPSRDVYSDEELKPLLKQGQSVPRTSLVAMLDEMSRVEDRIRWETYPRIVLEVMVVKLLDLVSGPGLLTDAPAGDGDLAALKDQAAQPPRYVAEKKPAEKPAENKKASAPPPEPPPVKEEKNAEKAAPPPPPVKEREPEKEKPEPPPAPGEPVAEKKRKPAPEKKSARPEYTEDDIPDPEPPPDVVPRKKTSLEPRAFDEDESGDIVPPIEDDFPPIDDLDPVLGSVNDAQVNRVRSAWKDVLAEVKRLNVPSYFSIANGIPVESNGGVMVLEFDSGHRYHMEQVLMDRNREVLDKALENVLEEKYMVRCRVKAGEDEPAPAPAKEPQPKAEHAAPEPVAARPPAEAPERESKSTPQELSLFDTLTDVFPNSKEIEE